MSSFKKRVGGQKVSIKLPLGSKLSTQNGQLLISSGISSLDEVLGGGLPVGSLNLVLEDQFTNYSSYLLKYFLAQGVSNSQPACLIGGEDRFWSSLPGIYHYDRIQATTPPKEQEPKKEESDDLKIAWRYKNLPNLNNMNSDSEKSNPALDKIESNFCNRFDLTNSITDDVLSKAQKHHFNLEKYSESNVLEGILDDIKQLLKSEFSSTIPTDPSQPRKILRVAVNSLGSPFYNNGPLPFAEVYKFLTQLKGLMRFSYATLMVTLPAYIYSPSYLVPIYHLFDSVISLDTFTQEQAALAASGHHGFFRIVKSPSINTIQPSTSKILQSNHNNFVFKLSRKQFTIEPYVLPPELGDSPASSGCSSQNPSQNISSDILENFSQNKPSSQPKRITSHLGFNNNGNSKKSLDF